MCQKKFTYTVSVEDYGSREVYICVKADSAKEAKRKATELFIKDFWRKKHIKATVEWRCENRIELEN